MNRSAFVTVMAVLLVAGGAIAAVAGIGALSSANSGDDIEPFPTESTGGADRSDGTDGSSPSDGTGGDDATTGPPFTFTVDRIEECGETCRDVTATLTNEQSTADSNVTVYTRIYAGNGTDGDVVWEGTETVGDLDAGESYPVTKRVELSMSDALAVQQADGWITVQTTVESDEEIVTVTEQRQVA